MTHRIKRSLKSNILKFSNLVLLIGIVISLASSNQKTKDEILILNEHKDDKTIHITVDKIDGLEAKVDLINEKIDLLLGVELNKPNK